MKNFVRIESWQISGMEKEKVVIEALRSSGMGQLTITGLPDSWLRECRDKIRALVGIRVSWGPMDRVLVQLFPPDLNKVGAHLELPIFLAAYFVLQVKERKKALTEKILAKIQRYSFVGALSLEGRLEATQLSRAFKNQDPEGVIGPSDFANLEALLDFLHDEEQEGLVSVPFPPPLPAPVSALAVQGRYWERFLLLLAAIMEEPVLMMGAPGLGKSYLARWAHALLPPLGPQEWDELQRLRGLMALNDSHDLPFVNPHSRVHLSELMGVQSRGRMQPGLLSQAHGGLLVLDEFSEMNRDCREILRTVLDQKKIQQNLRCGQSVVPARFWLILTSNPCPCGQNDPLDPGECRCREMDVRTYQNRLSGPLLDRMGLKIFLRRQDEDRPLSEKIKNILDANPSVLGAEVASGRERLKSLRPLELRKNFHSYREKMLKEKLMSALSIYFEEASRSEFFNHFFDSERRNFSLENNRIHRKPCL